MNKIKNDIQNTFAQPSKNRDADNRGSKSSSIELNDPEDTEECNSESPKSGNVEATVEPLVPYLNHTSSGESKHEVTHSEADGGEQPCQEKTPSFMPEQEPLILCDQKHEKNEHDQNIANITRGTADSSLTSPENDDVIVLYKRRWYILFVLSMCVTLQNAVWGTWGPIAESAKYVYGWDTTMVFLIINFGNIGVLLPALYTGHMISSKGLRVSMIACSFLLALGSGLRTISRQKLAGTILVGAGQFCNGLAGSITQVIPAALSETWFPVNERATATAIGVISNSVGSIVAFMLGPNIVDEPIIDINLDSIISNASILNTSLDNFTTQIYQAEQSDISHQIWVLTMIEFGVGALLFIITLVYFPAKPPTPPSRSARAGRVNFTQSLCKVIRKPLILLAALSCAVPWAVFGNWMGLLNVNLHEIGISQSQSGFFGFYASIAGVVGGIVIGRVADRFQRRLKLFVTIVFFLALLIILWISCMRNGYLPRSVALFAVSISALGVMMNAALPLCYEMTCECGYPVHEGIIGTFISLEINAAAVIFLLTKFIPHIGVNWMNWTFVGVLAVSIIFLLLLREKYRRTDVDLTITVEMEKTAQ